MPSRAKQAIQDDKPPAEVAKAAAADAADAAGTESEKEAIALQLYKEATGRFPQDSSDRREVYRGAFWLVGIIFALTVIFALAVILTDRTVPDWISALATALGSGVIGGLFGYAKQT